MARIEITQLPATTNLTDAEQKDVKGGAAVDYYLKIDTIDGESTDDRHKGEIEVLSFSWGATPS